MEYITYNELLDAYKDCLKHKSNTESAISFQMNEKENLLQLFYELNSKTYEISPSICFVFINNFKVREVFAALFKDRIVHHYLILKIYDIIEKYGFSEKTYSCRKNKGTDYAVNDIQQQIQHIHKSTNKIVYYAKCDIKRFFVNIDKNILFNQLNTFLNSYYDGNDKDFILYLFEKIIFNDPTKNAITKQVTSIWKYIEYGKSLYDTDPLEKGIPVGNLTSLFLANFYLSDFDRLMMSKVKGYGRYVDDFILLDNDKEHLKNTLSEIKELLKYNYNLTLNTKKLQLQKVSHGISFLGKIIKPYTIYVNNEVIENFKTKLNKWCYFAHLHNKYNIKISFENVFEFTQSMNSYLGLFKRHYSYNIISNILSHSLIHEWNDYISINSKLTKFSIKPEIKILRNIFIEELNIHFLLDCYKILSNENRYKKPYKHKHNNKKHYKYIKKYYKRKIKE